VVNTFEIMADRHDNYADITVCGEAYLDVHHCLVGKKTDAIYSPDLSGACTPTMSIPNPPKPRVTPLHSLKHVSTIISHPQAFGQCDTFLNFYLKGVPRVDATSTSEAAKLVKEDESGSSAAIASILTADLQDLDVLAKGIEDS
jgi:prephenate dehydratase